MIFGNQLGWEKFDWEIAKALKSSEFQESQIPDKVEMFQVHENDIHKAAERIKILTRTGPFQLPLLLQTTPEERISVLSTILSI